MSEERNAIRVLLVDDQPLFVQSLARVIEFRAPDIEVLGIAENGDKAVQMVRRDPPDIVVMDIQMPVMNGVEAARIIYKEFPEIRTMMLTTFDEDEYIIESLQYGSRGYLLKNIPPEEVITAIRALYSGINQISPQVISRITSQLLSGYKTHRAPQELPQWFFELTNLEKEILKNLSKGMSNKEIASIGNLAEQTVKNYLSTIYEKLGVNKRAMAVRLYLDHGIDEYRG